MQSSLSTLTISDISEANLYGIIVHTTRRSRKSGLETSITMVFFREYNISLCYYIKKKRQCVSIVYVGVVQISAGNSGAENQDCQWYKPVNEN